MPRATLPIFIALLGILGAAAMALTTYTLPIEGASSDPELYNLLAAAVDESPLAPHPSRGHSPLPITELAQPDTTGSSPAPSTVSDTSQPHRWAQLAAAADPDAIRHWLGPLVVATAGVQGPDTFALTLHRISLDSGCPLLSTLSASFVAKNGHPDRLVHLQATCPRVTPG